MGDDMMVKKRGALEEVAGVNERLSIEETASAENLRASLEEIKKYDGVIGYILRNSTSAAIDLKDPGKIIDYATLSSSSLDAAEELSKLFDLNEVSNVVIEGKNAKVLSLIVYDNRISVFMDKDADHHKILRKLQLP